MGSEACLHLYRSHTPAELLGLPSPYREPDPYGVLTLQLDRIEAKLDEVLELERGKARRQMWADYKRLTAEWRARGGP